MDKPTEHLRDGFNRAEQKGNIVDAGDVTVKPVDYKELGHEHISWNQPNVTTEVYPDRTVITIMHVPINNHPE